MVRRGGRVWRDTVHVDGEGSDLPPAFGGVGTGAETGGRVEVLDCSRVDFQEG